MRPSQTQSATVNKQNHSVLKSLRPRLFRGAAAGLIATVIMGTTGCKSMPFELPKPTLPKLAMPSMPKLAKPNMSKLAFWKSENLMAKKGNLPKPPSLSFDPSPINKALASSKESVRGEVESLRSQIAETKDQLTAPIREPYKVAAWSAVDKLADRGKFEFDPGSSRNSLPKSGIVDEKITKAQRDFQAALASSSKAIEQSIGDKVADLKPSSNDFKLPASVKSAKQSVDNSLMAVNRSLYNSKGKLASAADKVLDRASGSSDNQLSRFEQRLKQAATKTKAATSDIASVASKSASNAFGGIAPPKPLSVPAAPAASDNVNAEVSSQVAQLQAQLAQLKSEQEKFMKQQLAATKAPAAAQVPAPVQNFQPITPPQASPVASQPQRTEFVASLTARPTQPQSALPPVAPSARPQQAYPQMYPSNAPLRTASSTNHVLSSAPQNVLRENFSPVANQQSGYSTSYGQSEAAPARTSTYPDTNYPRTQYHGYGTPSNHSASATPAQAPNSRAAQVSFQENGNSNLVITASTPVEPAQQHVSEVNIPDAVLQGTSHYAPGTVHPLRR
jgi:hypothetical protein